MNINKSPWIHQLDKDVDTEALHDLHSSWILLDAGKHTLNVSKVILCTNGFENFEIFNEDGLAIDKKFHHLVDGIVGYYVWIPGKNEKIYL